MNVASGYRKREVKKAKRNGGCKQNAFSVICTCMVLNFSIFYLTGKTHL
jgi:hypothetical protein